MLPGRDLAAGTEVGAAFCWGREKRGGWAGHFRLRYSTGPAGRKNDKQPEWLQCVPVQEAMSPWVEV